MKTQFIEVTQGSEFNWGKFMVGQFDEEEWERQSMLPGHEGMMPLLRGRGWAPLHFLVLDIETGEAAMFNKGGLASADLDKHRVWVCPMFEPFLEWLYVQDFKDVSELPRYVKLDTDIAAMAGYRRRGPDGQ